MRHGMCERCMHAGSCQHAACDSYDAGCFVHSCRCGCTPLMCGGTLQTWVMDDGGTWLGAAASFGTEHITNVLSAGEAQPAGPQSAVQHRRVTGALQSSAGPTKHGSIMAQHAAKSSSPCWCFMLGLVVRAILPARCACIHSLRVCMRAGAGGCSVRAGNARDARAGRQLHHHRLPLR